MNRFFGFAVALACFGILQFRNLIATFAASTCFASSHSTDNQSTAQRRTNYSIVFGISTVARHSNLDYLRQTVHSMLRVGISTNQIFIHHGKNESHPVLDLLQKEINLPMVPRDTRPISIEYNMTRPNSNKVQVAYKDGEERKRWRIQEAHDFLWLSQCMLDRHESSPHIGIIQDDVVWALPLPNLTEIMDDAQHSTISLYTHQNFSIGQERLACEQGAFCGAVALVFRRRALEMFVNWSKPLWKEMPIDWSLAEFWETHNITVSVHRLVRHIGEQGSFPSNKHVAQTWTIP